jgi:ABC-type bacteriocin/lantibiotic exporter with double-glycine peptidase domain
VLVALSTGAITYLIRDFLDEIFIAKNRQALVVLPIIVVRLYLIQSIGRYAQTYQLAWIGETSYAGSATGCSATCSASTWRSSSASAAAS